VWAAATATKALEQYDLEDLLGSSINKLAVNTKLGDRSQL
jgi:hypothetical protein